MMNCVPSTYNASGKLVGCTEEELNTIISAQLYTVFALGAGLYMYKSFTAENWADIAINLGWGCVSAFTHTKRFARRHVIPMIFNTVSCLRGHIASIIEPDSDSEVSVEDDHCYVRVVKDGVELQGYSSIFGLIQRLSEHVADARGSESSDDVVDVNLNDAVGSNSAEPSEPGEPNETSEPNEPNEPNETDADQAKESVDDNDDVDDDDDDDDESDEEDLDIKEEISRIENHTMKLDFVLCQVPTMHTATSATPLCMHVIKYDGFPRETDGSHFFDRKFTPVNHRMIEIVLQYGGSEYELNLASPDNFYVAGNKLLDPAFLKWFMRKNHGMNLTLNFGAADDSTSSAYTIKCIDHNATLHTLQPCNYLRVSETGFEVHDSGLV